MNMEATIITGAFFKVFYMEKAPSYISAGRCFQFLKKALLPPQN